MAPARRRDPTILAADRLILTISDCTCVDHYLLASFELPDAARILRLVPWLYSPSLISYRRIRASALLNFDWEDMIKVVGDLFLELQEVFDEASIVAKKAGSTKINIGDGIH